MTGAISFPLLLWVSACAAFVLTLALGLLFNLIERSQRARPGRLDHFGSRYNRPPDAGLR